MLYFLPKFPFIFSSSNSEIFFLSVVVFLPSFTQTQMMSIIRTSKAFFSQILFSLITTALLHSFGTAIASCSTF